MDASGRLVRVRCRLSRHQPSWPPPPVADSSDPTQRRLQPSRWRGAPPLPPTSFANPGCRGSAPAAASRSPAPRRRIDAVPHRRDRSGPAITRDEAAIPVAAPARVLPSELRLLGTTIRTGLNRTGQRRPRARSAHGPSDEESDRGARSILNRSSRYGIFRDTFRSAPLERNERGDTSDREAILRRGRAGARYLCQHA